MGKIAVPLPKLVGIKGLLGELCGALFVYQDSSAGMDLCAARFQITTVLNL
jgi:hypothetical protein